MVVKLVNWQMHNKTNGMSINALNGMVLTRFESLTGINKEIGYNAFVGGVGDYVSNVSIKPRDVAITLFLEHVSDNQYYTNLQSLLNVFHAGDRVVIVGENLVVSDVAITGALSGYVTKCDISRMSTKGVEAEIEIHCTDPYIYPYDVINKDVALESLLIDEQIVVDAVTEGKTTTATIDISNLMGGNVPSKIRGEVYCATESNDYFGLVEIKNYVDGGLTGHLKNICGGYNDGGWGNIQGEEWPTYFNTYEGEIDCKSYVYSLQRYEHNTAYLDSDFDFYVYPKTALLASSEHLEISFTNAWPSAISPWWPDELILRVKLYAKERWL